MAKQRAQSRAGMVILTVAFPPDLHRKLAIASLDRNATMNELIRQAVRAFLAPGDPKPRRKGKA